MKRIITICTALLTISAFCIIDAEAIDLSAGASFWYSDWDFELEKSGEMKVDPALMYGPVISLGFNKEWSWSNLLLMGKFDLHDQGDILELTRIDFDSTANYNLNRYIKVFAGGKYMRYDNSDNGFHHKSLGPAAGLGFTFPLVDNLFLIGTASAIYMWGNHSDGNGDSDYTEPGYNTTLAFAYYFDSISTTVTLGGRYQYFRSYFDNHNVSEDCTHKFYGISLSAIYTFNL